MSSKIIQGGRCTDHRGVISYVNDFSFTDVKRFYIISNSEENPIRTWHGHKLDAKKFYCITGAFNIHFVKIDDWEKPSKDLEIETVFVSETDSKVVHIPAGYANAIESLENNSKLISFSTLPFSDVNDEEDLRFSLDYWKIK